MIIVGGGKVTGIASVIFAIGGIGILLSNAIDGSLTWKSIFWGGVGVSGLWSGIDHWKEHVTASIKDGECNEEGDNGESRNSESGNQETEK